MFNYSNQPQSLMQVFKDAFRLYKTTFSRIIIWSALLFLIISLFSYSLSLLSFGNENNFIRMITITLLTMIGFMIIYLYGECILLYRMHSLVSNQEASPKICFKIAGKKILKILVPFVFSFVALFIIVFFVEWSSAIIYNLASRKLQLSHVFLGLALPMIISVTIIGLYYLLFMPWIIALKIIFDNDRICAAIKKSFTLLVGNWWQTFVSIFLVLAFMGMINQIVSSLIGQLSKNLLVLLIPMIIVYALVTPYFNAVLLVQFNNLKQRVFRGC